MLTNPENGYATTLNHSAFAIWELCDGRRSTKAVTDIIAGEFGTTGSDIHSEVSACVAELCRAGLLVSGDPDPSPHHPDTNIDEDHLGGYIRSRHSVVPTLFEFEHGDPATWNPDLWRWAYETLGIRSVIDVGCAEGHAAHYFRDLGCDVVGVDGSRQAKRDSLIPEQHVLHDFTLGPYQPSASYDLVWCCEFVEHVEERFVTNFLETFAYSKRYLMMTYASPGQPGFHHVNCQQADYWIDKVETVGFRFDPALTDISRSNSSPGHYQQRGLFFTRD